MDYAYSMPDVEAAIADLDLGRDIRGGACRLARQLSVEDWWQLVDGHTLWIDIVSPLGHIASLVLDGSRRLAKASAAGNVYASSSW